MEPKLRILPKLVRHYPSSASRWRRTRFRRRLHNKGLTASSPTTVEERIARSERRTRLEGILSTLPRAKLVPGFYGATGEKMPALILRAPEVMSIEANREGFLSLIYSYHLHMFGIARAERRRTYRAFVIDLKDVKHLTLDAALVLTAEYHRRCLLSEYKPVIDDEAWSPEVRLLLQELGFYELVDAHGRTAESVYSVDSPDRLRFVQFLSGERVEQSEARKLIDSLRAACGQEPEKEYIYAALVEAIKNVKHHAYLGGDTADGIPSVSKWWVAGAYDPEHRLLQFAVYDQGVGIPKTLPKRPFFESVRRFCRPEFTDADVIAGGIRYSRTRFKSRGRPGANTDDDDEQDGRGNGLWTICHFLKELDGSSVRIVSGRGEAISSGGRSVIRKDYNNPFCGTLIQWNLKLPRPSVSEGGVE